MLKNIIEIKNVIEQKVNPFATKYSFLSYAEFLQSLVSTSGIEDGYERYILHQELARNLAKEYCEKFDDAMIIGFFGDKSVAEELSLFGSSIELVDERFRAIEPINSLFIGYGPESFSTRVRATFDASVSHDWGWADAMGRHIEYYNADTQEYIRSSMTGRTCYTLKIKDGEDVEIIFPTEEDSILGNCNIS